MAAAPEVKIHCEIAGHGPTDLVMLHGFGSSRETWRDIAPLLAPHYRLCLVDLKGHGLSSKPRDGKYSVKDHADAIASLLLARQRGGPMVLVGNSLGGAVALIAYLNLRSLGKAGDIRGLILIDSAGYPQRFPFYVSILRRPLLNGFALVALPTTMRASVTLKRLFCDKSRVDRERIQRYARNLARPGSNYALIQTARQIVPADIKEFTARIPSITVPVLLIWGANDPAVPLAIGRRFESDLPDARLAIIPNCGHLPQEERPPETAALVREFLQARVSN